MAESIGQRIRYLRQEKGLTQEELAVALGIEQQLVADWELGLAEPDSAQCIAISDVLQVSTGKLLKGIRPLGEQSEAAPLSPDPIKLALWLWIGGMGLIVLSGFIGSLAGELWLSGQGGSYYNDDYLRVTSVTTSSMIIIGALNALIGGIGYFMGIYQKR